MKLLQLFRPLSALGAVALVFAGCATNRIDWNARVGAYTFDEAVIELGPPEKQAKLTDGSTVAEWLRSRTQGPSRIFNGGYGYGVAPTMVDNAPVYENFLRLTFGPGGKLTEWKRITR